MFQFLFKYPVPVFTKGRFVLLGAWPAWAAASVDCCRRRGTCAADPLEAA